MGNSNMSEIEKGVLWYFYHWEKEKAQKVFLRQPVGSGYIDFTWQEVGSAVRKLAAFLQTLNLPSNSNIGLVSKNCAEWVIADLAIMMSGHVVVPFYPSLSSSQLNELVAHSGCPLVFFGKLDDIQGIQENLPKKLTKVSFPTYNPDLEHLQWDDILKENAPIIENLFWDKDQIYSIIYTSGTTGNPKGVMVSHKIAAAVFTKVHTGMKWDVAHPRFFSYLPLAHAGERCAVEAACIRVGGIIYFAENLETFSENLRNARPTHFFGVPRIWSHFKAGILQKIPEQRLSLLLKIPVISNLIKQKIKKGLGLQDAALMIISASPVPVSLLQWFRKLDIELTEVYGMTENLGVATIMPESNKKDGTVGKAWDGLEIKILPETQEVCTRSSWNMDGYYKEPELTAEAIDAEGWLHTGDTGEMDEAAYLKITGRIKEICKTSKGEYVAPASVERLFEDKDYLNHICVLAEGLPKPIALVILNEIGLKQQASFIERDLAAHMSQINSELRPYERLKKVVILSHDWTAENNKLTPTLKLKRGIIEQEYTGLAEKWFNESQSIIWASFDTMD